LRLAVNHWIKPPGRFAAVPGTLCHESATP
jgi:hypothetical protein